MLALAGLYDLAADVSHLDTGCAVRDHGCSIPHQPAAFSTRHADQGTLARLASFRLLGSLRSVLFSNSSRRIVTPWGAWIPIRTRLPCTSSTSTTMESSITIRSPALRVRTSM